MNTYYRKLRIVSLFIALLITSFTVFTASTPSSAEEVTGYKILLPYSVGMLDSDGTVLYSVILISGEQALENVTVEATIPEGMTFVDMLTTPDIAQSDGLVDGQVTWQIEEMAPNNVLGPFTYRVMPTTNSDIPAVAPATVSWSKPEPQTVETLPMDGTLEGTLASIVLSDAQLAPLAELGKITLDDKGTLNQQGKNGAAVVGDTGIVLQVPSGAVSQPVNLTFTRLTITEDVVHPDQKETWWCSMVTITADKPVTFNKPISLALPTRQTLTPFITAKVFVKLAAGTWQALPPATDKPRDAFVDRGGNHVILVSLPADVLAKAGDGLTLAVGVNTATRNRGSVSGDPNANNFNGSGVDLNNPSIINSLEFSRLVGSEIDLAHTDIMQSIEADR